MNKLSTKQEKALKLTTGELCGMDIETLQSVAQSLGVGPRQDREELVAAIQQQQRRLTGGTHMNKLEMLRMQVDVQGVLIEVSRLGDKGDLIAVGVFRLPTERQQQQAKLAYLAAESAALRRLQ